MVAISHQLRILAMQQDGYISGETLRRRENPEEFRVMICSELVHNPCHGILSGLLNHQQSYTAVSDKRDNHRHG